MQKMVDFPLSIPMVSGHRQWISRCAAVFGALLVSACGGGISNSRGPEFELKFWVGSALESFCQRAAEQFNQQGFQLETGETISLTCEAQGSGDVVETVVSLGSTVPDWRNFC